MLINEILEDFEEITEFLEDLNWKTTIYKPNQDIELPTMVVSLPLEEDYNIEFICNFIPIGEEAVEYTKLLQLFTKIPVEVPKREQSQIMQLINAFNSVTGIGHFFYNAVARQDSICMKYTIITNAEERMEGSVVAETLLLMIHYCQMMEGLLFQYLNGDGTAEEIVELIYSVQKWR